jgi:hypothetical protein
MNSRRLIIIMLDRIDLAPLGLIRFEVCSFLGSPIRKLAVFPLTGVGAMVLSANISAVGDAAGAVLIIVENLPVPADRRVWPEATALHQLVTPFWSFV